MTGRISDVKIDPNNPSTWYIATAFGGLWKTTNRGASFTPLFDDQGAHNLCCIEIDPKKRLIETSEEDNISCVLLRINVTNSSVMVLDNTGCDGPATEETAVEETAAAEDVHVRRHG